MKDKLGSPIFKGSIVAYSVLQYRISKLRHGKVLDFDGKQIKVQSLDGGKKIKRPPNQLIVVFPEHFPES